MTCRACDHGVCDRHGFRAWLGRPLFVLEVTPAFLVGAALGMLVGGVVAGFVGAMVKDFLS